jgi:hypothetical protein
MKERPQAEKTLTKLASNRSSFSGVSGDGMQKEGGYATVSPTISNMNVEEVPVAASHDVSSSLAEFLEKEKLCKVFKNVEVRKYLKNRNFVGYGIWCSSHFMTVVMLHP